MVNYYKYVPIVLMLMAFFFAVPHYLWGVCLNLCSGLNLDNIVEASTEMLDPVSSSVTESQADSVADRLLQYTCLERSQQGLRSASFKRADLLRRFNEVYSSSLARKLASLTLPFRGSRLFGLYILMKIVYTLNVSLTLWGLAVFLDVSPMEYLGKLFRGIAFEPEHGTQFSGRFPTVTICQYTGEAQVIGKLLRFTSLCVIPFNVYYDKIFATFYFLFVVLLALLVVSIPVWIYKCCDSRRFFVKYLGRAGPSLERFDSIATFDMMFILRLIENNSDAIVTFNLLQKLNEKLLTETEPKKESFV